MPKSLSVKSLTLAVLLVVAINLLWSFYQIHLDRIVAREAAQHGVILCDIGAYAEVSSRIYIGLSLFAAFIGSWVKGFKSPLISLIGLAAATLFYVLWWRLSFRLAELSSPSELEHTSHVAYLYQANYLDIVIAASIGLLFLLHIRRALLPLFRPTKPCS
jgi:hypothetical protein